VEHAVIDGDQSHGTCADAIHSDDLEATIQGGLVSLDQIIEARWRCRPECNPDAAERQRFLRFLPELERLYGAGRGGAIQDTYFSRHILAGTVLIADHEIHFATHRKAWLPSRLLADRTRYRYVRRPPQDGATDTVPYN
jgi:hypothetical protein